MNEKSMGDVMVMSRGHSACSKPDKMDGFALLLTSMFRGGTSFLREWFHCLRSFHFFLIFFMFSQEHTDTLHGRVV